MVSLDVSEGEGGETLEGGNDFLAERDSKGKGTSYALVVDGTSLKPHPGRVDSAWGLPDGPGRFGIAIPNWDFICSWSAAVSRFMLSLAA